ncbi:MAG TPA: IS3 family transposase [Verrucomicrobiae bacterium]|nr:IS3 family transposase [Verrucomicrobiae bacterium]
MENEYDLTLLCTVLEVSRSGFYAWSRSTPSARQQANTVLLEEMQQLREGPERCYGSPRMTRELQSRGHSCSENRIARLMRGHGLRAQAPPRFIPRTTDSNHDLPIAPKRLAERPAPDGPNQVWLQDFTYVPTAQGWLYLALVLDLWSGKIVGWAMAAHMRSELVVSALQMACTQRRPASGLLVHSDRGVQYASQETQQFLQDHGLVASMSRTANPCDNAWMESAIGKIKSEVLGQTLPADHQTAREQLFIGIESWYNQRRRHSALDYQSPVAFETKFMTN